MERLVLMRKKMETQARAMVKGFPTRLSIIILYVDHQSTSKQQQARNKEKMLELQQNFLRVAHTLRHVKCWYNYRERVGGRIVVRIHR